MTAKVIDNGVNRRTRVAHLPAGKYAVGDPCYFVPDALWMEYLECGSEGDRIFDVDGKTIQLSDGRLVAAHGTSFGDGLYHDQDKHEYGVDAGLLGAVQLLDGDTPDVPRLGQVVEFTSDFTVEYEEEGGVVVIGHIRIATDYDEVEYCSRCGLYEVAAWSSQCESCDEEDEREAAEEEEEDE